MSTRDEVARIKKALAKGRMVYDTGRKCGKFPIYEQLSTDGRKLMGLKPLEEIIPNWQQYLPIKKQVIVGTTIKPEMQVGDSVLVKWSKTQTYKGVLKEKLRKNWGVAITDDSWHNKRNLASVPSDAISKRCH